MNSSILIAGVGNIFQGDDSFGVAVAHNLLQLSFPENVRIMDAGIRSIDLAFALLDGYDLVILIDTTTRGGAPGTLYTIEIEPGDIPDSSEDTAVVNSHSLNPVRVLSLAKSMSAQLKKILLVGCEPLVLDQDESGSIGLSEPVNAAVTPAVEIVRKLVEEFTEIGKVCSHEYA